MALKSREKTLKRARGADAGAIVVQIAMRQRCFKLDRKYKQAKVDVRGNEIGLKIFRSIFDTSIKIISAFSTTAIASKE